VPKLCGQMRDSAYDNRGFIYTDLWIFSLAVKTAQTLQVPTDKSG